MYGNVLQSSKTTLSTKISPLSSQQRRAYTLHSPSDSELLTLMYCGAKTLGHHAQWTVLNNYYCSPLHDQSHNKAHLCPRDVPCPARGSGRERSVKPWWSVNRVEITDDDVEADERRGVVAALHGNVTERWPPLTERPTSGPSGVHRSPAVTDLRTTAAGRRGRLVKSSRTHSLAAGAADHRDVSSPSLPTHSTSLNRRRLRRIYT